MNNREFVLVFIEDEVLVYCFPTVGELLIELAELAGEQWPLPGDPDQQLRADPRKFVSTLKRIYEQSHTPRIVIYQPDRGYLHLDDALAILVEPAGNQQSGDDESEDAVHPRAVWAEQRNAKKTALHYWAWVRAQHQADAADVRRHGAHDAV